MLETEPSERAGLREIMNHPWTVKGFGYAPENFLPPRGPIRYWESEVVSAMTGFKFGPPESIRSQLVEIGSSREYMDAVSKFSDQTPPMTPIPHKRRITLASFLATSQSKKSTDTASQLENPLDSFNPLLSIYYMVQEEQQRDRAALQADSGQRSNKEES
jgi:hypothetical protein